MKMTKNPRLRRVLIAMGLVVTLAMILVFSGIGQKSMGWITRRAVPDASGDQPVQLYQAGMHPWIITTTPGNCPICGMKLEPIDPSKLTGELAIDPVIVQNMGVRVEPVMSGPLTQTIRTVGTVDYDETRVRDINTKVTGWIEKLYVDSIGAQVQKGQALFSVYSPQLYAAQEEYLSAYRNRSTPGLIDLLDAARTRLAFFDISPAQIDALQKRGTPAKTLTIESPYAGVVIKKHANEGMNIEPGMQMYRIADLSRVWVMASVYDYQLPYLSQGQEAVMTLSYIPGQTFEGKVAYIYPYLNEKTREIKVRIEFDNKAGLLRPGMFVNVELKSTLSTHRTLAPRSAILDTGQRKVAFVSLGQGRFEPRSIVMGVETQGGQVEIISGLEPGEMVVTSGQFMLDSEARTRETLAKMVAGTPVIPPQKEKEKRDVLSPRLDSSLNAILRDYLVIGDQLAHDTIEGLASPAQTLATLLTDHHDAQKQASQLAKANDLAQARQAYADLSLSLVALFQDLGVPASFGQIVEQLHCPMYRDEQGGSVWIQPAGTVRNPFLGSMMLGCFDQRIALPMASSSATTQPTTQPRSQP